MAGSVRSYYINGAVKSMWSYKITRLRLGGIIIMPASINNSLTQGADKHINEVGFCGMLKLAAHTPSPGASTAREDRLHGSGSGASLSRVR
jgi:hypothetical protein